MISLDFNCFFSVIVTVLLQEHTLEDWRPQLPMSPVLNSLYSIVLSGCVGVKVGDIGPKFDGKGMDNGFLQLTNVCIPRDQMLMKYTKVHTYSCIIVFWL